ncbi:MAG TPA: hypothetical protein VH640_01250 [Bryobacteraceae bacterium]
MRPVHVKIGLFVFLWHEITVCFACGADLACLATVAVFFGAAIVRATGIEIAGMTGPVTAAFVQHGVLWLVVYFWLAPGFVRNLPISITLAGFVAMAFVGAWSRRAFFVWIQDIDGQWFRDRSEAVVGTAMGGVAVAGLAHYHCGSILPLVGYILLPGLPFSFGWLAVTPAMRFRFDAQFGDNDTFHDIGASGEF